MVDDSKPKLRHPTWLDLSGVFRLAPADVTVLPALLACVSTAIPLVILMAVARLDVAAYAAAGAFTGLYGRNEPYRQRAQTLAAAATSLIASVAIAGAVGVLTRHGVAHVLLVAAVAGFAKLLLDGARAGPPGGLMPTFAAALTVTTVNGIDQLLIAIALCAAAAAWSWVVCMSPRLVEADGPQRIAAARALEAVARRAETAETPSHERTRHAAALALERAWHALSVLAPKTAEEQFELILMHAETVMRQTRLAVAAGSKPPLEAARECRRLAAALRDGSVPRIAASSEELAELAGVRVEAELLETAPAPLLRSPRPSRLPGWTAFRIGSPDVSLAVRTALAAALAGLAAVALGLGHSYWASVSAVAVLAPMNLSGATRRAVQRAIGSAVGVLIGVAALAFVPGPAVAVVFVIACTGLAEWTVTRNYGLALLFATPVPLLLEALVQPLDPLVLARDRLLDTVLGAVVAVAVALLLPNRGLAQALQVALDAAQAALVVASTAEPHGQLAVARTLATRLLALRAAYDAAIGEPWSQDIPVEQVLSIERDSHIMLAQLTR